MADDGTTRELTPQERAALIAWHLAHGEAMTTRQVAELTGLEVISAYQMMDRLAGVLPIRREGGTWAAYSYDASANEGKELASQERAALVAWQLACGETLTLEDIIELTGLTEKGARALTSRLVRVLPVYRGTVWAALQSVEGDIGT
jgi:hypothetical protein